MSGRSIDPSPASTDFAGGLTGQSNPRAGLPLAGLSARFARDGFAAIDALTTPQDIALIRSYLEPLFERFDSLGERAVDLAGPRVAGVAPRSPEINEAVILEPRLRKTATYLRCRDIARHLLRAPVGYQFDHAIFKPPHNKAATAWHQDEAYNHEPIPLKSIHFWIPLQAVTEESGCMCFVPGSHRGPFLDHTVISPRAKGGTLAANSPNTASAVACPLPLGGATIHHPLTLHYTGPNQSGGHRRAWILHFGAYGKFRHRLHPKAIAATLRAWKTRARAP